MPNWCYNVVDVVGRKKNMLEFAKALIGKPQVIYSKFDTPELTDMTIEERVEALKKLREEGADRVTYSNIVPMPDDIIAGCNGQDGWYAWRLSNWGVKWDISNDDINVDLIESIIQEFEAVEDDEENVSCQLCYSTPWSPPVIFLLAASEKFDISFKMSSEEPGCCIYQTYEITNGSCELIANEEYGLVFKYLLDGEESAIEYIQEAIECVEPEDVDEYFFEELKALFDKMDNIDTDKYIEMFDRALDEHGFTEEEATSFMEKVKALMQK